MVKSSAVALTSGFPTVIGVGFRETRVEGFEALDSRPQVTSVGLALQSLIWACAVTGLPDLQ